MRLARLLVNLSGVLVAQSTATFNSDAAFFAARSDKPKSACSICAFRGLLPKNASVVSAIQVEAGGSYGEGPANVAYPINATELPELCAVTISVRSSKTTFYRFGMFLPVDWNERFLAVGNGGLAGGINWADMGYGTRYGHAVISTDTGHNSTAWDVTWAFRSEDKRKDWGYRAMEGSVKLGKQLVEAYYQKKIQFSYYSGTSTGGRQGLKEIQLHADSFDGALLGAPAWWVSHLSSSGSYWKSINLPLGAPHSIPVSSLKTIADEVMRQCDEVDGVKDGIISDTNGCKFDVNALACDKSCANTNANASACLVPAQIDTLKTIYSNYSINGSLIYPGMELSSELMWPSSVVSDQPPVNGYINYFLLDDPDWIWEQYNDSLVAMAIERDPGNSTPDDYAAMGEFAKRGGKMIMFHGWADGLIVPKSSLLLREFIANATADESELDNWFRLFMAPGMQHSRGTAVGAPWYIAGAGQTRGRPGPRELDNPKHNGLLALMDWVEKGTSVDQIIATSFKNDSDPAAGFLRQRPWCVYPKKQLFKGGDEKKAENWECT
ncbi:uncharacterized protein E0L32_011821 [Thyridium curvatum]|uniref:Carboxylic ester hydrolase n=1 Tax=Thyridium curvatum TaxID=1093900 RepID=A0A507BDS3_9PEZI|nr:uncharacterized protein E0L32_011821 [Thyridium curvatum]TPX18097.1 hypothetical protein E0L32_011821 [Thyridium curvatum]